MWILRPTAIVCLLVAMASAQEIATPQQPTAAQAANKWAAPASALATQIASLAGPGPATLVIRNASSIPSDQVAPIRRQLEAGLKTAGIPVRQGSEGAAIPTAIRVTLSQNAQHGLWVAEVMQGTETRVAMVEVPLDAAPTSVATSAMTLRKQLVFTTQEQVLDAQMVNSTSGAELVVLSPARIAAYHQNGSQWQQIQSSPVSSAIVLPRDPRGLIVMADSGSVRAYLPGTVCDAASADSVFQCSASDDPWPIGTHKAFYNASRNYFSGVLAPAYSVSVPPFYSAAEFTRASGPATVFSDVRGPIRLFDHGAVTELSGSRDWGSDIVSIRSGCGSGTQLLADTAGDPAQDSLRAYDVNGREATAVSVPLSFEDSITSMHTAADGTSASVIIRSSISQTAAYEVWRVSLECH